MNRVFDLAQPYPFMAVLVHFLYDAGARIQDTEDLPVDQFVMELVDAAHEKRPLKTIVVLLVGKKGDPRAVPISPVTLRCI